MQNSNSKENQVVMTPYKLLKTNIKEIIYTELKLLFTDAKIIVAPSEVHAIKYNNIEIPLSRSIYSTTSISEELLTNVYHTDKIDIISPLVYNSVDLLVRHIKYRIIQQHSKQINDYKGMSIIALNVKTNKMESYSNLAIQLVICVKFGILFSKTNPIVEKLLSYCNHCPNRLICALKPSAVENENDTKLLCPILKGVI